MLLPATHSTTCAALAPALPLPGPALQVRGYEVYRLLEEKVRAMVLALPLVQDLHHPAMRDRHWSLLMKVGGAGGAEAVGVSLFWWAGSLLWD